MVIFQALSIIFRDHTTVMHAVKKVEELSEHDSSFAEDVELLRRMLEG